MSSPADDLRFFLAAAPRVALVEVAEARGSTPREAGAWMLVGRQDSFGTIGGGQLEYMAIDKARQALGAAHPRDGKAWGDISLSIPLGPEIGQCCGGRVEVTIRPLDAAGRERLMRETAAEAARQPAVYLFGGGHVGRALAAALSLLPLSVTVVETRAEALEGMPTGVATRLTPVPEEVVRTAPPGAAYVILTHDHALDFLIAAEALGRADAAYVGMIGSKTKRATFRSWYMRTAGGTEARFARLVSPIGGEAVRDKRPTVIAALATAEIMTALAIAAQAAARTAAGSDRVG